MLNFAGFGKVTGSGCHTGNQVRFHEEAITAPIRLDIYSSEISRAKTEKSVDG
jgi:hypothetical protein